MKNLVLVAALALVPSLARAEARLDGGQIEHGFVAQAHLGSELVSFVTTGPVGTTVSSFSGCRAASSAATRSVASSSGSASILARTASGTSTSGGGGSTSTATDVIPFVPGVSVAIVRSADKRVELFGQFDIGLRHHRRRRHRHRRERLPAELRRRPRPALLGPPAVRRSARSPASTATSCGTRARAAAAALPSTTSSSGLTSIFAQLQVMAVF